MTAPVVYVVEPDSRLRALAARVAEREARAQVAAFETLAEARAAMSADAPALAICRWSDEAGESAFGLRPPGRAESPEAGAGPYLLILTEAATPERIAAASAAGRAELLTLRPFDPEALANRLVLLIWGVDALRSRARDRARRSSGRAAPGPAAAEGAPSAEAARDGAPVLPLALRRRLDAA
ncbi:hypothetical protein [Neomegalonema sp.]|uniref:hypothetical protein n=1 Tax=Neomegalonema sp. TaxID=2039713 RepID=UPI002622F71D|nr:hypothetical protein [Neomegalonema sp.]MDD2867181.1 hypothetical protein [Neomegalonema sp.]